MISSLYPDIISGIVTGLIVGIIIILFQKGFENRLYLKSLQRELALFKENIRFVLDKQVLFYINNIKKLPEPMDAIASLIRSNPIDLWYEKLAKQRSFLRKIKQFQNALLNFSKTADEVHIRLKDLIRHYNANHDSISANDINVYVYYIGKLSDYADSEIIPYLDIPKVPDWVKDGFKEISLDEKLNMLSKTYINKKSQVEAEFSSLRDELKT